MLPVSQLTSSHFQSPQNLNLPPAPSLLPLPKPFPRQAHPPYCSLPTKHHSSHHQFSLASPPQHRNSVQKADSAPESSSLLFSSSSIKSNVKTRLVLLELMSQYPSPG